MAGRANWWAHPGLRLAMLRQIHTYIGAFIAPSVLFFALTGALQLFSLHEAHGDYVPPPLIEKLSKVHKDQVFAARKPRPQPGPEAGAKPGGDHDADHHDHDADHHDHDADHHDHGPDHADHPVRHGPTLGTLLLKWVFLAAALGLTLSTSIGVWMGVTHTRHKGVVWALLILGTVLPIGLLLL